MIFDVTNQITYKKWYTALLRVWDEMRREGNATPQVAFLCPFWDPPKVVHELYRDLYEPGLYPDLWFRWEGKPLILADPNLIHKSLEIRKREVPAELRAGHTLGQTFKTEEGFGAVGGAFPTYRASGSGVTLTLYRGGPGGEKIASRHFEPVQDNAWVMLALDEAQPAGEYYLEASEGVGKIGWWSQAGDGFAGGQAYADGEGVEGDRTLRVQTSQ